MNEYFLICIILFLLCLFQVINFNLLICIVFIHFYYRFSFSNFSAVT